MTERFTNPVIKYTTATLKTMPGAQLLFFVSGTTTPKVVYQDFEETIPHGSTVTALSDGHFPPIFLNGTYRVELKYLGIMQPGWPVDDIGATNAPAPFDNWNNQFAYLEGQLVTGADGNRYQSLQGNNLNNEPSASPLYWSQVFLGGNVDSWEQLDTAARSGAGPKSDAESAIRYSLDLPVPLSTGFTRTNPDGTYTNRTITETKTDLSLDNVSNTSDANKPISTAQANALALKADLSYVNSQISGKISTLNAFADLALQNPVADQVFFVKGESLTGQKGRHYIATNGSLSERETPSLIASATPGIYFRPIGEETNYAYFLDQSRLGRSFAANTNAVNYDKNIYLFGDSHGWGQGAPEWDTIAGAGYSPHSSPLFNRGFMARIYHHIFESRGYQDKINSIGVGAGLRALPTDSEKGKADFLVNPMTVVTGRVLSAPLPYNANAGAASPVGWFTPFAFGSSNDFINMYRDKLFKGRFNQNIFRIYPQGADAFSEIGNNEYISLLPVPGLGATGGAFTDIAKDGNDTILAEGDPTGNVFNIRVSDKIPSSDLGFFISYPQNIFIPGFGPAVALSSAAISGARNIRVAAANGTSYPTDLSKYIHPGLKIYRNTNATQTTVMATPEKEFRKLYISVHANPAGRKIQVFLSQSSSLNGTQWDPNTRLAASSMPSLKPTWNNGTPSAPLVTLVSNDNNRISSATAAINTVDGGQAVVIDTYSAANEDRVYQIDFGTKVFSDVFIRDGGVSANGSSTNSYSSCRGILFDNNQVTNFSMGGHTIGAWLGIVGSFSDGPHDHLADILSFAKASPYLAIVELPLVNEYLSQTSLVDFKANIATLIQRVNEVYNPSAPARNTDFVFFTTIGHRSIEFEGGSQDPNTYQEYSDAAKEQCSASNVVFVDVRQMLKDKVREGLIDYKLLYSDPTHPSGVANELIAEHLIPIIDQML